jgi:nitrate/nitrite transport system substrate-binding protein
MGTRHLNDAAEAVGIGPDASRRHFIGGSGVLAASTITAGIVPGPAQGAWSGGSDAPEKKELRVGFLPLTDCAPVVLAATEGFDRRHGIKITPVKETSWAAVRDKLITGELDAAHALYGMVYGVQMGIGGIRRDMAVLMTLNRNGQGISLSRQLLDGGVADGASLQALVSQRGRTCTFAQTFPTGTHAMWLNYWLAAHGIDPLHDVRTVTVPPPQMGEAFRAGRIDGCCVGEPWNARVALDRVGFTAAATQEIWPDHPEKVLGASAEFVDRNPNSARALIAAVLEGARYAEAWKNRSNVAQILADSAFVDTDAAAIEDRLHGRYDDGRGRSWEDRHAIRFFADGEVSYPWLSDGMWFLTQQRRWGLLKADPDYLAVASRVNRVGLYAEAATQLGIPLPSHPMRSSTLMDGVVWNGSAPARYAGGFGIRAA